MVLKFLARKYPKDFSFSTCVCVISVCSGGKGGDDKKGQKKRKVKKKKEPQVVFQNTGTLVSPMEMGKRKNPCIKIRDRYTQEGQPLLGPWLVLPFFLNFLSSFFSLSLSPYLHCISSTTLDASMTSSSPLRLPGGISMA